MQAQLSISKTDVSSGKHLADHTNTQKKCFTTLFWGVEAGLISSLCVRFLPGSRGEYGRGARGMEERCEWASTKVSTYVSSSDSDLDSCVCRHVVFKPVNVGSSVMRSGELDSVAVRGAEAVEGLGGGGGGGGHAVLADFPLS